MSKELNLPNISPAAIPDDLELRLPENIEIEPSEWHFLLEIPWNNTYFDFIPSAYEEFFKTVLPHLHVRTTDVHTAVCLGLIGKFQDYFKEETINWRVVTLALILHDCGWSKLTQAEVAMSLGVTGLALSPGAKGPKIAHAEEGKILGEKLLREFTFNPPLSPEETNLILQSILYHDQPEKVAGSNLPLELQVLVDLDHLWSFTHQNFWQDTVRKGVEPSQYAANLKNDLGNYFVTAFGKKLASAMLEERESEIFAIIAP